MTYQLTKLAADGSDLPPMPEPPDLSNVSSWDRADVARRYYLLRSIALEARLRLAVKALDVCYDALRAPIDDWKGVLERKAMDARHEALAAIGEMLEEKP